tara:strand:- start:2014 stop:2517 length:504 start_codon:yes stop_codon:yes gene_type:complete
MALESAWRFLKALPEQQRFRVMPYAERPWNWEQLDRDVNRFKDTDAGKREAGVPRWSDIGEGRFSASRSFNDENEAQRLGTIHPAILGLLARRHGTPNLRTPEILGTPKDKKSKERQKKEVREVPHGEAPPMQIEGVQSDEDMDWFRKPGETTEEERRGSGYFDDDD